MEKIQDAKLKDHGRKAVARKEAKVHGKSVYRRWEELLEVWRTRHIRCHMHKMRLEQMYFCAVDEEENDSNHEVYGADKDLQAWCILDKSEHEQRQEVISKRPSEHNKSAHTSILGVDNCRGQ